MRFRSADLDLGVGDKLVRWQEQVLRRRTLPDAARGVIHRAMARAEPAAVFALVRKRNASEVRADADDYQPLVMALFDACRVRLRIGQRCDVDLLCLLDLLLRPMEDEDRLRTPEHLDDLSVGDRSEIDVNRRPRRDGGRVRVHLRDQRNEDRRSSHRADGAGGNVKKVAARVLRRRHGRHVFSPLLRWLVHPARGWNPGPKSEGRRGGPVAAALKRQGSASVGFYWHPCRKSASPQKRAQQKWTPVLRPGAL